MSIKFCCQNKGKQIALLHLIDVYSGLYRVRILSLLLKHSRSDISENTLYTL